MILIDFLNKRPGVVQPIQLKMRCVLAVVFHGLSNDTYVIAIGHILVNRFLVTSFSFAPRTVILERPEIKIFFRSTLNNTTEIIIIITFPTDTLMMRQPLMMRIMGREVRI